MNEQPDPQDGDLPQGEPGRDRGRIGLGTITLMVVFLGIIGAMCLVAAVIMAIIIFR
jgi:hypothetical protein